MEKILTISEITNICLVIITGLYTIFTYRLFKKSNLSSFEENYFKMIENFHRLVSNFEYVKTKSNNSESIKTVGDEPIEHQQSSYKTDLQFKGIEAFKELTKCYICKSKDNVKSQKNDLYKELKESVQHVNDVAGSQLKQLFVNINEIIKFISKKRKIFQKNDTFYRDYLSSQIPTHLKFIIVLFRIYLDQNIHKYPKKICIKGIVEIYDFKNFLEGEAYQNIEQLFIDRVKRNKRRSKIMDKIFTINFIR